MAKLNISPTKSSLLALRRQLAFAREGYDLLEQKRQILIFELMGRLKRARAAERAVEHLRAQRRGYPRLFARVSGTEESLERDDLRLLPVGNHGCEQRRGLREQRLRVVRAARDQRQVEWSAIA